MREAHLQPQHLRSPRGRTELSPLHTPHSHARSACDGDASPRVIQYAEQVGWLSSRTEELQAALDFQAQRAAALQGDLEAAHAQLAAQEAELDQSAGRLAQEHAGELDALEARVREEREGKELAEQQRAGLEQRLEELEARCGCAVGCH